MAIRRTRFLSGRLPTALAIPFLGAIAVVVVLVTGLFAGSELMEALARQPAIAVRATQDQAVLQHLLELISDLESDRRGYQLTPTPDIAGALRRSSGRVADALRAARRELAEDSTLLAHLGTADRAIEEWLSRTMPGDTAGRIRGGVAMDEQLLGTARVALRRATASTQDRYRHAEARRAEALTQARDLWLILTVLGVLAIFLLGDAAWRWQARVRRALSDIRLMLDALPFALLSLDRDGRILRASGSAAGAFGLQPAQLEGKVLADVVAGSDRSEVEAAIVQARAGAQVEVEALTPAREGESRVLVMTLASLPGPLSADGPAVSVVVRDVTAERAFQTQVAQADRLAAVGSLVAGVAHELNNPLNAIATFATLVDRARVGDDDRQALDTIVAEAKRAGRIVRNLLDFSRQRSHEHEPTSVAVVVDRTVSLRRYNLRTGKIQLDMDIAGDLPAVLADPQELQQVFLNLIVNAEQAVLERPERRIVVTGRAVRRDRIAVTVEDSGSGIPEDKWEAVFEPFYTTKPKGVGTGLGLSLSRGIVTELEGELRAGRSAALGGACFTVELPALAGVMAEAASGPRRVSVIRPAATGAAGLHVLVADDEAANRSAVARYLQRLGYRVTAVENGQDALSVLEQKLDVACILSDVHMPVMDGGALLQAIEQRRPELAKRIAFLSGDSTGDPGVTSLAERGCPILQKPFELSELKRLVEQLTRSRTAG